nr:hypothetical protein [Caldimonas sp.]
MIEQLGRARTRSGALLGVAVTIVTPQPMRERAVDDKAPQLRPGARAGERARGRERRRERVCTLPTCRDARRWAGNLRQEQF